MYLLLFLTLIICMILFILPYFFLKKMKVYFNKLMFFECGFNPFFLARSPFSMHFFKLCLIFIIFDIEILIILPSPIIINCNSYFFFYMFFMILIFMSSLIIEWQQNNINWL